MPVADCGAFEVSERSEVGALESPPVGRLRDYEEIPLLGCPWQTMGRSRWASEARSVSSNPLPAAACWDYEEIPLSLGERSEVGALESHPSADCGDYEDIPLHQTRQTNKTYY